jgi:hypothetical protein
VATLSELADAIAKVEGLDRPNVALIARYLREQHLISKHGRGPSAAQMGLTDAANLLIAVNVTKSAIDASHVVTSYRSLTAFAAGRLVPETKYATLGDAIEQLIQAAGRGELPDPFLGKEHPPLEIQEAFAMGRVRIALKFRRSSPQAFIGILPTTELSEEDAEELVAHGRWDIEHIFVPSKRRGSRHRLVASSGDRLEETTIGYRTLSAIGKLIQ